jgi:phosphate transport system substrate-binding protein
MEKPQMPVASNITRGVVALVLISVSLLAFGCSPAGGGGAGGGGVVRLQGAGATFPNPLYQKWLSEYGKLNQNLRMDYQSIGSGGGIKQIQEQTIDFGASDSPMKDDDLRKAPGELLHVPTVLGAVVLTYNLTGIQQPLRFSPEAVAGIFLGHIKRWDDEKIKADNPGVARPPSLPIISLRSAPNGKRKSARALRRSGPRASAAKATRA